MAFRDWNCKSSVVSAFGSPIVSTAKSPPDITLGSAVPFGCLNYFLFFICYRLREFGFDCA